MKVTANWEGCPVTFCLMRGNTFSNFEQCIVKDTAYNGLFMEHDIQTSDDYTFALIPTDENIEVSGNITFDLSIAQIQTKYADNYYIGAFYQELSISSADYLVLNNPSTSSTYEVLVILEVRRTGLFFLSVLVQLSIFAVIYVAKISRNDSFEMDEKLYDV